MRRLVAIFGLVLLPLGLGAQVKPPAKPSAPSVGQSDRCVFQIDNVDRQGAVN